MRAQVDVRTYVRTNIRTYAHAMFSIQVYTCVCCVCTYVYGTAEVRVGVGVLVHVCESHWKHAVSKFPQVQ